MARSSELVAKPSVAQLTAAIETDEVLQFRPLTMGRPALLTERSSRLPQSRHANGGEPSLPRRRLHKPFVRLWEKRLNVSSRARAHPGARLERDPSRRLSQILPKKT